MGSDSLCPTTTTYKVGWTTPITSSRFLSRGQQAWSRRSEEQPLTRLSCRPLQVHTTTHFDDLHKELMGQFENLETDAQQAVLQVRRRAVDTLPGSGLGPLSADPTHQNQCPFEVPSASVSDSFSTGLSDACLVFSCRACPPTTGEADAQDQGCRVPGRPLRVSRLRLNTERHIMLSQVECDRGRMRALGLVGYAHAPSCGLTHSCPVCTHSVWCAGWRSTRTSSWPCRPSGSVMPLAVNQATCYG